VKKATTPIVALQFYQIEYYILAAIRADILDEVPFFRSKKIIQEKNIPGKKKYKP
jgi:hypothetical protein